MSIVENDSSTGIDLLQCFRIDDSELHWVSAHSLDEAIEFLVSEHEFEEDMLREAEVDVLDPQFVLEVRVEPTGVQCAPLTATCVMRDTAWNWCQYTGVGLIASTVY